MTKKVAGFAFMLVGILTCLYGLGTSGTLSAVQLSGPNLRINAAYKYPDDPAIYIWDGKVFRWVVNEQAFLRYYRCPKNQNLAQCATIYDMPHSVSLVKGEPIR